MTSSHIQDELNAYADYLKKQNMDELEEIAETIDKEKYPEKYEIIIETISEKKEFMKEEEELAMNNPNKSKITEMLYDDVIQDLRKKESPEQNAFKNMGYLIISFLLFISLGVLNFSVSNMIMIAVILLIHELGHLIGMKTFGYKNVRMFFIPFFGAAVTGLESNPRSVRKAIVAILGPAPGILIGVILCFTYFETGQETLRHIAILFLLINAFNLLPLSPLDGGHYIDALLFSRNPLLETIFKAVAAFGLVGLALYFESIVLGIFALMTLFSIRGIFIRASIAEEIRDELTAEDKASYIVPDHHVKSILFHLNQRLDKNQNMTNILTSHTLDIWQRSINQSAPAATVIGFILIYFLLWMICLSPFLFARLI